METGVEDFYRRIQIQIPDHIVTALRDLITRQFDQVQASSKRERRAHKIERDALRGERTKLLQGHYGGAVPLDLLASEQERIARGIAFLDAHIEAGVIEYEQA